MLAKFGYITKQSHFCMKHTIGGLVVGHITTFLQMLLWHFCSFICTQNIEHQNLAMFQLEAVSLVDESIQPTLKKTTKSNSRISYLDISIRICNNKYVTEVLIKGRIVILM